MGEIAPVSDGAVASADPRAGSSESSTAAPVDTDASPSSGSISTASADAPKPRRMHEIDGLRAVAVCLIVFHHSFMSALLGSPRPRSVGSLLSAVTTSGVELFFVLSGVLLLRPYLRGGRRLQSGSYLRRRVERLWPPYLAALGFAGVVTMVVTAWPTWYSTGVLPRFSLTAWVAQVGLLNFGWTTYSGAWWSLTIEVLFYLSVPVVIAAVVRCDSRAKRLLAGIGLATAAAAAITLATPGSPAVADLAAMFAPCFIMGALLARYSPQRSVGVALVGVGLVYILFANARPAADVHLGFALFYGGVLILSTGLGSKLRVVLSTPLAVWLGERSYSLFLVHFPVFYLANWLASRFIPSRTGMYFVVSRGVGLPAALLVAMCLFWLVERRYARGLATADSFWPVVRNMPAAAVPTV